jgi:hypothetical protein
MGVDRERALAELQEAAFFAHARESSEIDEAVRLVRTAMSNEVGLLRVAEAAATAIMHLMSAWEVTVTLIDRTDYWDIVDVCVDPTRGTRFSDDRYPLRDYPIGTSRMLAGKGYVSGEAIDEVMVEFERQWPEVPVGSIMSAPIVALGGVHGEVFLVRGKGTPPFTRQELDLACECTTLLGARLPALVAAHKESGSEPGDAEVMGRLTRSLKALLDE